MGDIYTEHHRARRGQDFVHLAAERTAFFRTHLAGAERILDVGCRDGALTIQVADPAQVTGIEVDPVAAERARKRGINVRTGDIYDPAILAGIGSFDAILIAEVLEHLYMPSTIVKRLSMLLRSDGVFLGSVPNAFSLPCRLRYLRGRKKGTPLQDPTHINQFSLAEFRTLLEEHFDTVAIRGITPGWSWLANLSPNLFGYDLAFACRCTRR